MVIITKRILKFLKNTFNLIHFLFEINYNGAFHNPLKEKYKGSVAVFANGPSLNEDLLRLGTDEFNNVEFIVLNSFAFEDIFFKIKPKHYCLADPVYIHDSFYKEDVMKLFKIFQEKICWDMNIYVPSKVFYKKMLSYSNLTNPYLHYIPLNAVEYKGYDALRHFFYKKGLSMPRVQTVANMAIYVGINSGFSTINLYGVDHSFFDSLCINDKNQICCRDKHFYDKDI
jgi:hypothetical protein